MWIGGRVARTFNVDRCFTGDHWYGRDADIDPRLACKAEPATLRERAPKQSISSVTGLVVAFRPNLSWACSGFRRRASVGQSISPSRRLIRSPTSARLAPPADLSLLLSLSAASKSEKGARSPARRGDGSERSRRRSISRTWRLLTILIHML